jgi:hypothetical protein
MQSIRHLGADPELFLRNEAGKFISSVGLIGGTKDFPQPIGYGCAIQEDNVAVEFNTPPCATVEDFIKSITYNKEVIAERVAKLGLQLCITPSAVFDDDQLQTEGAKTFGCDPDFNAWEGGHQNPRPSAENQNLRSAGGHIHIESDLDPLELVKAMDLFVGCPMIEFDTDEDRRKLYGKAGAFRKKPYGVEYRTASNAWIESEERIRWVWAQTDKAIKFVEEGNTLSDEDGMLIQKCINESNLSALVELRLRFNGI